MNQTKKPIQSVLLIAPQQPNDFNDLSQTPEIHSQLSIDVENFKRTYTDVPQIKESSFKSNTDVPQIKESSVKQGYLINQLLSDERQGKKLQKSSSKIFENVILITYLLILSLNPIILNIPLLFMQIIILITQMLLKYQKTTLLQVILLIGILILLFLESQAEINVFLIFLLTWCTLYQLWEYSFLYCVQKIVYLIFVVIQQCHTFTCLLIILNKDEQYVYNFQCFFGNFMGLGGQIGGDQRVVYYLLLIAAWSIFWIIKLLIFQEFFFFMQQEKFREQQKTFQQIRLLKEHKLNTRKLCNEILNLSINQREIRKIKEDNTIIHNFPIKLQFPINEQFLEGLSLFKRLSTSTFKKLLQYLEICYFQNQDTIIEQKQDDQSMYFIKKGSVQVFSGKQITELTENQYFGQLSFLTGQGRCASVRSKGESCLLKLRRNDFFSILNKSEIEIINQIKDDVIFNNNYSSIDMNCYNCMSTNHCIKNCPQMHLNLNKEKFLFEQNLTQRRQSCINLRKGGKYLIDDHGLVSSLGGTDHTNYQQNQSFQTQTQQSSLNQKMFVKQLVRTLENMPSIEQDSLKEQQFREIDQLFIRTANPKVTTLTAGFGENHSQKSPKQDVNNTISELQSEDSSEQESFEEENKSANEYRIKLRQSTYKSDRSQFRSGVSSISMNYTPKSNLSILNALKSDNNVVSQKQVSPLHLNNNPKKSVNINSQLNYETSPFITHSQLVVKNVWTTIECDRLQNYDYYYPHYNVDEVLIRIRQSKFTKLNTL